MSTYIRTVYQVVFSTKHRRPALSKDNRERLFQFIGRLLRKHGIPFDERYFD